MEDKEININFNNMFIDDGKGNNRIKSVVKIKNINKYISEISLENYKLKHQNKELQDKLDKTLMRLVFALSPTTHELSTAYMEKFKEICRNNIEEDTCSIRRLLKKCWEDKNFSQSEYMKQLESSDN